jgi:8-oxo-dGTP pyrophosphatase MutT (NUDIX family)
MIREFYEEVGVKTNTDDWTHFYTLTKPNLIVTCFVTFKEIKGVTQMESEKPEWININNLPTNTISNIPQLIQLALQI